ncbi:Membrane protein involved in the export of O-antigen and teichoic acid [Paraburkholderia sartisoli]|uniref:Membrane protein involved in the export of O-antigen and teichoic acid n=1 Tax=Paraburkholderia sartisoli TaxID=83784 RepID=A0A1H4CPX7_9BURK|nr:Membrane protein involved in the export of O-antigen and teichoic acid [Paraburkholderia sartisoli]
MIGVLILTACIQGGVIISQFLAAFYLSPNQVGVIRTVESVLSIVILGTSVGAPTLAIREIAALRGDDERSALLKRLICMELIVGALAILGMLLVRGLIKGEMLRFASMIAGVALLSNTIRVIAAFVQGIQTAAAFSVRVVILTLVAVSTVCFASWYGGVDGWVAGRYLGEAAVLIGLVHGVRRYFIGTGWFERATLPNWHVISLGITANLALFIRLLCDNLPILALAAAKVPTDQIGFFGLATLVLMGPNLILAVTMQVELPRVVSVLSNAQLVSERFGKLLRNMLSIAFAFLGLILLGWMFNREFLHLTYTPTINALCIMSFALPLRAITLSIGTMFTALGKYRFSVYVNLAELAIVGGFAYPLARYFATTGVILLFVAGSVVSIGLHIGALRISGLLDLSYYRLWLGRKDATN